jgi:anaerobic selenocysteine-containing dehydrogenase
MINPLPAIAQAIPGGSARIEGGIRMHVRGLAQTTGGIPTAALADEILLDDDAARIRALIVVGGNPLMAIPDQLKTLAAMKRLELLICIDPVVGATGQFADFVIAPKLSLECITTSALNEMLGSYAPGWGFMQPYAQWADPVAEPPAGSDVIEEWEFFYGLAQRLGLKLAIPSLAHLPPIDAAHAIELDMALKPTSESLMERLFDGSPVSLTQIRAHEGGSAFPRPAVVVAPGELPLATRPRLDVGEAEMMAELVGAAGETRSDPQFPFALISRRLHNVHNSGWHKAPNLAKREPHNAAYMHPEDLAGMGLAEGGSVEIVSARAAIEGFAVPSDDIRRGTVSMAHCWGDLPDTRDEAVRFGSSTARLIFNDRDYDPLTGIPRMSNIAVAVRPRAAVAS